MLNTELTNLIASLEPNDLLTTVKKWLANEETPDFKAWLAECAANLSELKNENVIKALRVILFCASRNRQRDALDSIMSIFTSSEFAANIKENDWMVSNMNRILGTLATAEQIPAFEAVVIGNKNREFIREQMLLSIHFMWIEKLISDDDVTESYRRIINSCFANDTFNENLALALALNGAVVGGNKLRSEVTAIIDSGKLNEKTPQIAKAVQAIMTQPKQFREIYANQHKTMFDKPEEEIPTIHQPVIEQPPEFDGKVKQVVRDTPKIGRNDPCPCGSGKKYKKCCGKNA